MARAGLLPHEKKLLETKDLVEAIGYDPIYSLSVGKCVCKASLKSRQCHSAMPFRYHTKAPVPSYLKHLFWVSRIASGIPPDLPPVSCLVV